MAIIYAIEKFRGYVDGYHFIVITDHSALTWLLKQSNLTGRFARWVLKLQQYNFKLKHIKGKRNVVRDALSRIHDYNLIQFTVMPRRTFGIWI